jgi:hypothetical protein
MQRIGDPRERCQARADAADYRQNLRTRVLAGSFTSRVSGRRLGGGRRWRWCGRWSRGGVGRRDASAEARRGVGGGSRAGFAGRGAPEVRLVVVRCAGWSGRRRERFEARERCGEFAGPAPRGLDAQRGGAGVEGQAGGDVQQSVAQAFGLGFGELTGQQQALGPGDQVVRETNSFSRGCLLTSTWWPLFVRIRPSSALFSTGGGSLSRRYHLPV